MRINLNARHALIALAVLFIGALLYVPLRGIRATVANAAWVSHTYQVRKEIQDIPDVLLTTLDLNRDYYTTHDLKYLKQSQAKAQQLLQEAKQVHDLIADSPQEVERMAELTGELNKALAALAESSKLDNFPPNQEQLMSRVRLRESILNHVQPLIDELDRGEEALLAIRLKAQRQRVIIDSILSGGVGLLAAAAMILLLVIIRRDALKKTRLAEDLQAATAAAQNANQSKSVFLANMSHEIRTPLGAILGFVDLISDDNLPKEERRQFLDIVRRNGKVLTEVIDDILDLSKVEAGQLKLEQVPISLEAVVSDIGLLLGQRARSKGLTLLVEPAGEQVPTMISSDPTRLRQILLNVIGNAVKFTDKGMVRVSTSWRGMGDNYGILNFEVVDTGPGISDEARGRLFQPFSQADMTTTRRYGGSGLGLALSRQLALAMGGDVVLKHSATGEGSIFVISLTTEATLFGRSHDAAEPATTSGSNRQQALLGRTVLVADDSPDNQLLITRILSAAGATVSLAADGHEAVTKACAGAFDVVLMDIQMPGLDGCGATSELRRRGYDGPILALTAHAMKEERERTKRSGCNDHIAKPIDREALISTVRSYCESGAAKLALATKSGSATSSL